jgi:hypothetical protein
MNGGINLCYKPSQQNQVHVHQCIEKMDNLGRHVMPPASAIYEIKPEQSRLKPYRSP